VSSGYSLKIQSLLILLNITFSTMPQLDKFAFAPQVLWLTLCFFTLYFLVLRGGLPVLYRVLLFRRKALQLLSTQVVVFVVESTVLHTFVTKVITGFLSSRFVADSLFKLVETYTSRFENKYVLLTNVRADIAAKSFDCTFTSTKLAFLPLNKTSDSLKVVVA
jgi:hypothetical protein